MSGDLSAVDEMKVAFRFVIVGDGVAVVDFSGMTGTSEIRDRAGRLVAAIFGDPAHPEVDRHQHQPGTVRDRYREGGMPDDGGNGETYMNVGEAMGRTMADLLAK